VAKWQTRRIQNPQSLTGRVGSSPSSGTIAVYDDLGDADLGADLDNNERGNAERSNNERGNDEARQRVGH